MFTTDYQVTRLTIDCRKFVAMDSAWPYICIYISTLAHVNISALTIGNFYLHTSYKTFENFISTATRHDRHDHIGFIDI